MPPPPTQQLPVGLLGKATRQRGVSASSKNLIGKPASFPGRNRVEGIAVSAESSTHGGNCGDQVCPKCVVGFRRSRCGRCRCGPRHPAPQEQSFAPRPQEVKQRGAWLLRCVPAVGRGAPARSSPRCECDRVRPVGLDGRGEQSFTAQLRACSPSFPDCVRVINDNRIASVNCSGGSFELA